MLMPKPKASLSSGLLARKGEARPAMRPQRIESLVDLADAGNALGWNDMGDDADQPAVLRERAALKHEIEAPGAAAFSDATATAIAASLRWETVRRGKIAFTLRLDQERHLRLRLAASSRGRSAQQLLTQALDAFLQTMPEVEALIAHLPPRPKL